MAQVDTQGAKTGGRRVKVKQKPAAKAPTPDQADRARAAQPAPTPDQADRARTPKQKAKDAAVVATNVRESRLKVVRKEHRGAGVRAVKRELEGKGVVAKVFSDAGERAVRNTGNPTLSRATSAGIDENVGSRAVKDVVSVPAQIVPSVYEVTAGAVEALQGHPERIKTVGKAIDEHDFVYNVGAAVVEAAGGDTKAAKKRLAQAKASAEEHPGYAALEVSGLKGTLARGAGRVMRTGATGKTLKRVASTERAPKTLEGTNLTVPREWSGDPITKMAQHNRSKSRTLNPEGDKVTKGDINRRVDDRVGFAGSGLDEGFVQEFGHVGASGRVKLVTPSRAGAVATDLENRTGHAFSPVKVPDTDRVALVPTAALDRLHEHAGLGHKTTLGQSMEVANDAFRRTVLTTSTSWALGNVTEGAVRSALVKAGPRSYITGHRLIRRVKALDPAKAEELVQRVAGGGHYGLAERLQVQDIAGKFAGSSVEPLANALHAFWKAPGPHQAALAWKAWTTGVSVGMRGLEKQFQLAQLGAHVRRSDLMSDHLVKLSHAAIDDAANGLRNTENQVRFARAVADSYGKYSGFSPSTRMLLATYSPFLPWLINAAKLVAWTVPREHPTVTLLAAAATNATEDVRKQSGLDLSSDLPGWLQGSISTKGGLVRAGRFTPAGAFADLPDTIAGQVLPLYSGPIMALKGLTFSGSRLHGNSEGDRQWQSIKAALGEWIDSTVPVVAQMKRLDDKGVEALNPLAPVQSDSGTSTGTGRASGRVTVPGTGTGRIKVPGVTGRVKVPGG